MPAQKSNTLFPVLMAAVLAVGAFLALRQCGKPPVPAAQRESARRPADVATPPTGDAAPVPSMLPGGPGKWDLAWSDEFDYPDAELDKRWVSQNGPSGHILCSRWRENAKVEGGTLKLINRKEKRGGQEWTSGSILTKKKFLYGYFECRYRYAAAEGTNNSFCLMTQGKPAAGKSFEIDINEGHYPNEINTNIHNWSDITVANGKKRHPSSSKSFPLGVKADVTIQLEIPVTARRLRLSSNHGGPVHLGEIRAYNVNPAGYPAAMSKTADTDVPGLVNFARAPGTRITASASLPPSGEKALANLNDGNPATRWTSVREGAKWVEIAFDGEKTLGCIQFLNGYESKGKWHGLLGDYKVQYHNGTAWIDMMDFNVADSAVNLARDFHTYGLEWTEKELVFYFNGKPLRREKNEFCYSPAPVWLSLAIIAWAGNITDAVHGTAMEVDYVRIYEAKKPR